MAMACLPKGQWLRARSLKLDWKPSGIPRLLSLDNAKEFHSIALRRGCEKYGISLEYDPLERGKYRSEARASMTIAEAGTLSTMVSGYRFTPIQPALELYNPPRSTADSPATSRSRIRVGSTMQLFLVKGTIVPTDAGP